MNNYLSCLTTVLQPSGVSKNFCATTLHGEIWYVVLGCLESFFLHGDTVGIMQSYTMSHLQVTSWS